MRLQRMIVEEGDEVPFGTEQIILANRLGNKQSLEIWYVSMADATS